MTELMTCDVRLGPFLSARLLGASRAQADRVGWELGAACEPSGSDGVDLTVRFVDHLAPPEGAVRLGDVAVDVDGWLYLAGAARGSNAWVRIDAWTAGGPFVVEADRRIDRIPMLQDLVNLLLFTRGTPVVHASSLVIDGTGVLLPGWMGGRKTEVLLSLVSAGASPIADEWTIMHGSPPQMTGIASPVRLDARHLSLLPTDAGVSRGQRRRVRTGIAAAGMVRRLGRGHRVARTLERSLRSRTHVDATPAEIFGDRHLTSAQPLSFVALVHPTADTRSTLHPVESREVAHRLAYVHAEHRRALTGAVAAMGYVDPGRIDPGVVPTVAGERQLLASLLDGVPCYVLRLSPSVDPEELAALLRARSPS